MTQRVTMPDGTVHTFPDEATPEMMSEALGLKTYAPKGAFRAASDAVSNTVTQGLVPLAYSGVVAGVNKAKDAITGENPDKGYWDYFDSIRNNITGQQDATAAAHPVASGIGTGVGFLASLGKAAQGAVPVAESMLARYAARNPVKTGAGIGATLGGINGFGYVEGDLQSKAESAASQGLLGGFLGGGMSVAARSIGNRLNLSTLDIPGQLTARDVRNKASNLYEAAENSGAYLTPEFTNNVINSIDTVNRPQTFQGQIFKGTKGAAAETVEDFARLVDQPLTVRAFNDIDKELSNRIDNFIDPATGRMKPEGRELQNIQTEFRNKFTNPAADEIVGNPEAIATLNEARKTAASAFKLDDIEKVIRRAELTDNPASALKSGFRALASNAKKMRGYSAAEVKALRKTASTGSGIDSLRVLGSRLNPIASLATGNPAIAAMTGAGSNLARLGATKVQMSRANDLAQLIANGGIAPRVADPTLVGVAGIQSSNLSKLYDRTR